MTSTTEHGLDALQAALEAAERQAAESAADYRRIKAEADVRARQFREVASAGGVTPTDVRDLADRARFSDPEAVDQAQLAALNAELSVAYAKQAVYDAQLPELERIADEAQEAFTRARDEALRARGAVLAANPRFNGHGSEVGEIRRRIDAATEAARAGAARRLAELTGQEIAAPQAAPRGNSLAQHLRLQPG